MAVDRRVIRTRTALFDALVALIRTKSYDSIKVEDILVRANVGRSTFYSHFTSKDELLERSLERLYMALTEAVGTGRTNEAVGDDWDPCRTLFEHVQRYQDVQHAPRGRGGIILREAVDQLLSRILRTMIPKDLPQQFPGSLVIEHIIATFHTVMNWWFEHRPELSAAEADGMFRQLVCEGLPGGASGAFIRASPRPAFSRDRPRHQLERSDDF